MHLWAVITSIRAVFSGPLWTEILVMLLVHDVVNISAVLILLKRLVVMAVFVAMHCTCYVDHLDNVAELIIWCEWAGRNGLYKSVSPRSQHKVLNFTFINASSNSEVAILSPLVAPRISYQLKHKNIFIYANVWFCMYHISPSLSVGAPLTQVISW